MDLRDYISDLRSTGELLEIDEPISLRKVTAIAENEARPLLFSRPVGCDLPLIVNAMSSRQAWGRTLGVSAADVSVALAERLDRPLDPIRVEDAPVQEVVMTGDEVDLTVLPAYLQHELDGAPYISAAIDVSKDPESGRYNTGVRRLMLRGPRETGVDLVGPTDGRSNFLRALELGQRFEIAFVIGAHPLDYIATQLHGGGNELAFMGGVRGEPVEVVQCKTVNLEVPAHAEVVLEGYLEGNWDTPEGPFGEYSGCYGASHLNPRFVVTALTRRHDAIYQSATIGGRELASTDTATLAGICTEVAVLASVKGAVSNVRQVYCPPQGTGLHHVRISIGVRDKGDGRNALLAALSSKANVKHAVVVDDDIDVFSDDLVEWAISTRFQSDEDLVSVAGMRTVQLDPSLAPHGDKPGAPTTGAKMGFDATRRLDKPKEVFEIPRPPYKLDEDVNEATRTENIDTVVQELRQALKGSARFIDLARALPRAHLGDIVLGLHELRAMGEIIFDIGGLYRAASQPLSDER